MKRTLVTGGTGFLGKHLANRLYEGGADPLVTNTTFGNALDYQGLCADLKGEKFDIIFHLAANTKAGDYSDTHAVQDMELNTLINTNMVRWWREHNKDAIFVGMGTSCSYSFGHGKETQYLDGHPEGSLRYYGWTKRMLLESLRAHRKQYGMQFKYFVPPTLYGRDFREDDGHFIFDFIRKIYKAKETGEPAVLWGDGTQRRHLCHVDFATSLMLELYNRDTESDIINIGAGEAQYLATYANLICAILGVDPLTHIFWDRKAWIGTPVKGVSVSLLSDILGYLPTDHPDYVPLVKGLTDCIEYYEEHFGSG